MHTPPIYLSRIYAPETLAGWVVSIKQSLERINGEYRLVEPKTKTSWSRRSVPLPAFAVAALREHRRAQYQRRIDMGTVWDGTWNLVFPTDQGRPQSASHVTHRLPPALERAGLPIVDSMICATQRPPSCSPAGCRSGSLWRCWAPAPSP